MDAITDIDDLDLAELDPEVVAAWEAERDKCQAALQHLPRNAPHCPLLVPQPFPPQPPIPVNDHE